MTPKDCPKFDTCNASICPLNPGEGYHRYGEAVCHYLLATGKAGADGRYADDPVYHACKAALPTVTARWKAIGKEVKRAAGYGFPGDRLRGGKMLTEAT
jgi:hypothetical protein